MVERKLTYCRSTIETHEVGIDDTSPRLGENPGIAGPDPEFPLVEGYVNDLNFSNSSLDQNDLQSSTPVSKASCLGGLFQEERNFSGLMPVGDNTS